MEIILSKKCEALVGSLGKGYGYYIRRARHQDGSVHFYSQRSKHPPIPADGHLRFIFACAELAQMKTHITDILVSCVELSDALWDARFYHLADYIVSKKKSFLGTLHADSDVLNANDIINFRNIWFR